MSLRVRGDAAPSESVLYQRDARETVVVGAMVMTTVFGKIYWISRIGFDNPLLPILETVGLSLFMTAAPFWGWRWLQARFGNLWWTTQSFLVICGMAVTLLAGIAAARTQWTLIPLFAIAGTAMAVWAFARWIRRGPLLHSLAFILGAAVFSVWCAGVVWGSRYKMPLFWETLIYRANLHHDPFYYATMANVMETYGVPSTGLDGIPLIRYHFGSPWLFSNWAELLNMDVLSFYSLGYPLIVMPLFFTGLVVFGIKQRICWQTVEFAQLRSDWRVWLVFLAGTAGFMPVVALDAMAVWNSNAFISESYLVSLPLFIPLLGIGLAYWQSGGLSRLAENKSRASASALVLLFLPVIFSAAGFLKVSTMLIAFAVIIYLVVRLRLYTNRLAAASLLLTSIAVVLTYRVVSLPAQNGGFSPLHFMRYDAAEGWQQFFALVHLLWTWVYVALRIREDGARDMRQLSESLKARRLLDVEVLLVIAVVGFLPGQLVSIHGGSAVYFSDVQRWIAVSFIIGRLGLWVAQWKERRREAGPAPARIRGWRGVRLSALFIGFVAAPFVVTLFVNLAQWPARALRSNLILRRELVERAGAAPAGVRSLANAAVLDSGVRRSTYYPIVTALRAIAALPRPERNRALLFIPQSNRQYWTMFTADGRCSFTPLIAPAVASMAMLDGMPGFGCEVTPQYNMTVYRPRARPQGAADVTDAALCTRAQEKGFSRILVLDAQGNGAPHRRWVNCYLPHT